MLCLFAGGYKQRAKYEKCILIFFVCRGFCFCVSFESFLTGATKKFNVEKKRQTSSIRLLFCPLFFLLAAIVLLPWPPRHRLFPSLPPAEQSARHRSSVSSSARRHSGLFVRRRQGASVLDLPRRLHLRDTATDRSAVG